VTRGLTVAPCGGHCDVGNGSDAVGDGPAGAAECVTLGAGLTDFFGDGLDDGLAAAGAPRAAGDPAAATAGTWAAAISARPATAAASHHVRVRPATVAGNRLIRAGMATAAASRLIRAASVQQADPLNRETPLGYVMAAPPRSQREPYDIGHFSANGRAALSWVLVAALAAAGLLIGWCLRSVVFLVAVPVGRPLRHGCPHCGRRIVTSGGRLPIPCMADATAAPPTAGAAPAPPTAGAAPAPATAGAAPAPPTAGAAPAGGRRFRLAWPASGRCPACRARIGAPPLAFEIITAVMLGALAARVHPGLVLAAACWLAVCALALAWTDAAVQRLPDLLTAPAYAGTAVLLLLAAAASGHWGYLLRAFIGGLALGAAFLALAVISRSAIGLGDAKLAASLGTMLAWSGWPTLIGGTFAGFLLAAVYGLALLLTRRATLRQRIPFGPFMIAGAFLALLAAF
jgi:leader peptidase (prepilin peptidase) / N-methyltransferase